MFRLGSPTDGSHLATLWSIVTTAVLASVFLRFGPFLFSLISVPSGAVQFATGVGCLTRIPEAIAAVREERRRTEAEQNAFREFATRVEQLDVTNTPEPDVFAAAGRPLYSGSRSVGDTTDTVRTLYRETVMAVDHYDEEYGEPLATNIAAELGPDVGTALSANDRLTTPLQQALVRTSHSAARERSEFGTLVQSEFDSLTDAETRLQGATEAIDRARDRDFAHRPFESFEAGTRQLQTAKQECESLIADRQAEYVDVPEEDGLNFREYLYKQYEWTYPVVGDALDVIERVQKVKEQIKSTVLTRV